MCLEVDYLYNNQNCILSTDLMENHNQHNENNFITMDSQSTELRYRVENLCGGSLIEQKPLFDPKGENIYVVRNDKIRIYNVTTGEIVTELLDNNEGQIIGIHLEEDESNQCLITCTINGHIAFWKLNSLVITQKKKLNFKFSKIKKFLVTKIDNKLYGFINYFDENNFSQLVLIDLSTNEITRQFNFPIMRKSPSMKVKIADGNGILVAGIKTHLYVINKETLDFVMHETRMPLYVIACHPEQQIIATGEVNGKIYIWNNVFDTIPAKTELHWHQMVVLSLAFSQSGTVLYSGGVECVLVKWQIKEKTLNKNFLPRVSGEIIQISVDSRRDRIAICLDDNSIQIINSNLTELKTLQDFTRVSTYDLGLNQPFPAGIHVNPKSKCLVMNGRIGHLQFFSSKSMKLMFNIDITMKNVAPRERNYHQFSTEVTSVAFSSCGDWMSTYECWNDRVSSLDSRLKFWNFLNDKQTYALHTQIENPHDQKLLTMKLANIENSVICASAGLDRVVKIWSLEASEEIQNPKMVWMLIEQVSYKNLPVRCLNFSQDASLLSAGFGNSLCVWDTTSFKLKCALSAPTIMDGSTNRVLITLPKAKKKKKDFGNVSEIIEKRQKMLQLMNSIIKDPSNALIKNITEEKSRVFKRKSVEQIKSNELKKGDKKLIFDKILTMNELNFNEKLQILHKLNIYYKISNRMEEEIFDYISRNALNDKQLLSSLRLGVQDIRNDSKYKILWRFKNWQMRDVKRNRKIITVRKFLKYPIHEDSLKMMEEKGEHKLLPIKNISCITNVIFCHDDLAHLVVVTTQTRILIWNLLTLKIQGSFKIQCSTITHDPQTNLIAIFTKFNELFIVHPSPAMTVFHQKNMPEIFSAIWITHDKPKMQSLRVNWQAVSQLLFLTKEQEICALKSPTDDNEMIDLTPHMDETNEMISATPFAAMISKRENLNRTDSTTIRQMVMNESGKVTEIINLSNHAMPPLSKLSKHLVTSLLTSQRKISESKSNSTKNDDSEVMDTYVLSDDENDAIMKENSKILRRKAVEEGEKLMMERITKSNETKIDIENRLKNLNLSEFHNFSITKK